MVRTGKHAGHIVELCYFGYVPTVRGRSVHIQKMQNITSKVFVFQFYNLSIGHDSNAR